MEAKLLPLLTEAALPIPETNVRVRAAGESYEVDFLWRAEKLVVETDGGRFHDNPAAGPATAIATVRWRRPAT